ncbi:hypothetical protein KP509_20G060400 [Ceratopteris richardii]|uniref:Uncharacterized protein n=1 Tax=Ceratopteris richardii TaxID=49495 RepID=A0A8T2SGF7_CERRI|nr:hypothetical protein KP509_20G060400 [Ceratopteris richardii]
MPSLSPSKYHSHVEYDPEVLSSEVKLKELFEHWLHRHGKNYSAPSQRRSRFEIFKQNLIYIHHRNQGPHPHKLGLNRFADLSNEEFRRLHLGLRRPPVLPPSGVLRQRRSACRARPPSSVDWREHGAVTPVKDQGSCGSCWAFSSVGAIEGAHAIATGQLISLSEQELVSCVTQTNGCDGGLMDPAFEWVIKNGGINTETGYPYVSAGGRNTLCSFWKMMKKAVRIDGYVDVTPKDENSLMCAVAQQPVSVAINAGGLDFQLYAGGVFSGSCSDDPNDVDHAVLAVGYGSDNGKDYWIVKNSWSEQWGMGGYVNIERKSNSKGGCGIYTMPSYPVVKTSGGSMSTI